MKTPPASLQSWVPARPSPMVLLQGRLAVQVAGKIAWSMARDQGIEVIIGDPAMIHENADDFGIQAMHPHEMEASK